MNWNNVKSMTQRNLDGRSFNHDSPIDALRMVSIDRFAWPGGGELVLVTTDGGLLCSDCCRENYENAYHSAITKCNDGWQPAGLGVIGQDIGDVDPIYCDHCSKDFMEEM